MSFSVSSHYYCLLLIVLLQRYTNAHFQICRYNCLHTKIMQKVSHSNNFQFLRYAYFWKEKCFFANIQKQQNMSINKLLCLKEIQNLQVNISRIMQIRKAKFSEYFQIITNIQGYCEICIKVLLKKIKERKRQVNNHKLLVP